MHAGLGLFDELSHEYQFYTTEHYGFGNNVVNVIRTLHGGGQSKVQINGFISHQFLTKRSVRKGCSLSEIPYTLAMMAERELTGITILQQRTQMTSPHTKRTKNTSMKK
jgi:hypothetical protein